MVSSSWLIDYDLFSLSWKGWDSKTDKYRNKTPISSVQSISTHFLIPIFLFLCWEIMMKHRIRKIAITNKHKLKCCWNGGKVSWTSLYWQIKADPYRVQTADCKNNNLPRRMFDLHWFIWFWVILPVFFIFLFFCGQCALLELLHIFIDTAHYI